ncbi:hypothetical protein PG997_005601 [Apiospora hydei]|uniref:Uncharacterized protein n=1 Tax=Apiospora hydei TaxID=1337664 RepID=A0ABR1WLD9_9PEZI
MNGVVAWGLRLKRIVNEQVLATATCSDPLRSSQWISATPEMPGTRLGGFTTNVLYFKIVGHNENLCGASTNPNEYLTEI